MMCVFLFVLLFFEFVCMFGCVDVCICGNEWLQGCVHCIRKIATFFLWKRNEKHTFFWRTWKSKSINHTFIENRAMETIVIQFVFKCSLFFFFFFFFFFAFYFFFVCVFWTIFTFDTKNKKKTKKNVFSKFSLELAPQICIRFVSLPYVTSSTPVRKYQFHS